MPCGPFVPARRHLRRTAALFITVTSLLLLPVAAPSQAQAASGVLIYARVSDKCLDVALSSHQPGAPIIQWDCHGAPNQRWRALQFPDGSASWQNALTGQCLDIAGASPKAGAQLVQWPCHYGQNQRFRMGRQWPAETPVSSEMIARHSGKCLDVPHGTAQRGWQIQQWDCFGAHHQQFARRLG